MYRILISFLLALAVSLTANSQDAKTLYQQGKALYDAKNYAQAFPKLKAAAEKGHKKAQYRLGRCYEKGRGVAQSDALAYQWYSKSAAQEYSKAEYQMGMCFKDGRGTAKNREKAFSWLMRAARQEYAEAQYQVGKSYLKGKGTPVDRKKAKTWLQRAVKNEKGGDKILQKIKKKAAEGDEDAKVMLTLIGDKK